MSYSRKHIHTCFLSLIRYSIVDAIRKKAPELKTETALRTFVSAEK